MSQIRPPEEEMAGRRLAYRIAAVGFLIILFAVTASLLARFF